MGPLRVKRPGQQHSMLKAKLVDETTLGEFATIPPPVFVSVLISIYRKVTSSDTSHLEAHAGFFRLLMNGIFDPYVL